MENVQRDLIEFISSRKKVDPSFSLNKCAKEFNMPESTLRKIKTGARNASLVQAKKIFSSIQSFDGKKSAKLSRRSSSVGALVSWKPHAVYHLLETAGFEYSKESIAERLKISLEEVDHCLDELEKSNYIIFDYNQEPIPIKIDTKPLDLPTSSELTIRNIRFLENALENIQNETKVEFNRRHLRNYIFRVAPSRLEEAKRMISEYSELVMRHLETPESGTEVYSLQTILIPLTKKYRKKKSKQASKHH